MPGSCDRSCLLILLVAVVLVCAGATTVMAQTDDDVRRLIDQLDDDRFRVRSDARDMLETFIKMNRLTPAQLGLLRTYPANPTAEQIVARARILTTWTTAFSSVRKIVDSTRFETTDRSIGRDWFYRFDSFFGGANTGEPAVVELMQRFEATRNPLLAADTTAIVGSLMALKEWVDDKDRFDIFFFHFDEDLRRRATRKDVVDKIQEAIDQAEKAIQDINIGSNNVAPPPRKPAPIQGGGAIDIGRTFRLALGQPPATPGGLDIFIPPLPLALSSPPPGFEFVGEVVDLRATDALEVAGRVAVGIEYGDTQLNGNAAVDPSILRIARLANGRLEVLDEFINDTTNFVITGFYVPDVTAAEPEQFGEFAVVQRRSVPISLKGSASRVGFVLSDGSTGSAQVRLSGKFTFAGPLALDRSTLMLRGLLAESSDAGELLAGLPTVLVPRRGSKPNAAIFESAPGAAPSIRVELKTRGDAGLLEFSLKIDRAVIPKFPQLCSDDRHPTTPLTTTFIVDDGVNAPVGVSTTQAWQCRDLVGVSQGSQARLPRSLRLP